MTVGFVCDSSCNIPQRYINELAIAQVPAWINFADGTSLRNGVDISDAEFYRRLETEKQLPTTSQPTPDDFAQVIETIEADEVVVGCVSSVLSGTYASAVRAAELLPDRKIHVYDTLNASMGAGWQVVAGAELAAGGADTETILKEMQRVLTQEKTMFVIDTLTYLAASGRAPAVQAFIGNLLNIKPLLEFIDGRIESVGKVRGRNRSKRELLDRIDAWAEGRPLRVAVINANVPDEAAEYAQTVEARLNVQEVVIVELGPVLGTLAGPGTLALAAYPPD